MVRWLSSRRVALAVMTALFSWAALGSTASASCVWFDATVAFTNGEDVHTPWPEQYCLVPTPWTEFLHPHVGDDAGVGPVKEFEAEGSIPAP